MCWRRLLSPCKGRGFCWQAKVRPRLSFLGATDPVGWSSRASCSFLLDFSRCCIRGSSASPSPSLPKRLPVLKPLEPQSALSLRCRSWEQDRRTYESASAVFWMTLNPQQRQRRHPRRRGPSNVITNVQVQKRRNNEGAHPHRRFRLALQRHEEPDRVGSAMTTEGTPPAYWYDDPNDPSRWRYWNGKEWEDHYEPKPPSATRFALPAVPSMAVEVSRLRKRVKRALSDNLSNGEVIQIVIPGANGQAMIGTTTRVFVIKPGLTAGATFGAAVTSWNYANVAGVQVHKGMVSGSVVIQAPGQTGQHSSYWGQGKSDPHKAPNAIPIGGGRWDLVRKNVARLQELIDNAQRPQPNPSTPIPQSSVADELKKLAELRDSGVLSGGEFEQAKRRQLDEDD